MKAAKERIYFSKKYFEAQCNIARCWRHTERYMAVRSKVYGNVLDLACGTGYGSYILSTNPDVKHVFGVDLSDNAIAFANKEYADDKIAYYNNIFDIKNDVDILVSIETIEHIENINTLPDIAKNFNIKELIISYPHIKSTHFNSYHFHDFNTQQIKDLFYQWVLMDENKLHHDVTLLHFVANPKYWYGKLRRIPPQPKGGGFPHPNGR